MTFYLSYARKDGEIGLLKSIHDCSASLGGSLSLLTLCSVLQKGRTGMDRREGKSELGFVPVPLERSWEEQLWTVRNGYSLMCL